MLVSPDVLPRTLEVDAAARARTAWVVQMLGVREVALGAGVLAAQGSAGARSWTAAGTACDLVDALVLGAAVRRDVVSRPWGGAIALSALAAGAVSGVLAGRR
jgi:peptide-methionine (R)-S-oxide reductase